VNLNAFKELVGAEKAELAAEDEIGRIFDDCQVGAEPPFGNLYDLPTIMEQSLEKDEHIAFQAGSHEKAVRMTMEDYRRLVQPKVGAFSYESTS
jgi:Ala-tRNA(Pro) deacylase